MALIALQVWLGSAYAVGTPLWQAPDEPAHANYVAAIAGHPLQPPTIEPGDYPHQHLRELVDAGFPAGADVSDLTYEDHQPPAYYYLAAAFYRIGGAAPVARVHAVRMFGVLLGALSVALTWQAARAAFPGRPSLALGAAGLVASLPMLVAITAAVNNDALAIPLAAAIAVACLRRATRVDTRQRFRLTGGVLLGAALWTKVTLVPLAVPVAVAELAAGGWRRASLGAALMPLLVGLALASPWFLRNARHYGPFDPLGLAAHQRAVETDQPLTADYVERMGIRPFLAEATRVTFDSFWGVFGWMGEFMPPRIYKLLALATAASVAGLAIELPRLARRPRPPGQAVLAVLAGATLATTCAFLAYNLTFVQHQGRYFFPALVPIALGFVLGLHGLTELAAGVPTFEPLRAPARAALSLGLTAALAAVAWMSLHNQVIPHLSSRR